MKKYVYIIFLLFFTLVSKAQNVNIPTRNFQIEPKLPMVNQFLRYDEIPVSEYTGLPNILIPLYNIEVDDVNIPINLTYHAGGIKVNQDASWVGLGWDLTFGSIVQTINDIDDFETDLTVFGNKNSHGNIKMLPDWLCTSTSSTYGYDIYPVPSNFLIGSYAKYLPNSGLVPSEPTTATLKYNYWISQGGYFSVMKDKKVYDELFRDNNLGGVDSEPDIFTINLLGEKLNVIWDFYVGTFVILNKTGYQISKNGDVWKVIDPNKSEFYFIENTLTITDNISITWGTTTGPLKTARVWMLNKIITKYGKEIIFSYKQTKDKFVTTLKSQSYDLPIGESEKTSTSRNGLCSFIANGYINRYAIDTNRSISEEAQLYLSSIDFPAGHIQFSISQREDLAAVQKLDEMNVYNMNNERIKSFLLRYGYFLEKDTTSSRLKLLSVTENNAALYSFSYNETTLPPKNSFEQDYWGYYNGSTQNKSLIPNPSRFSNNYRDLDNGNNLSANLQYTKAAVLEEITYPTGGKTCFDYELNQFSNYWVPDVDSLNNKVSKGLGLRIKSLIYKDVTGKEVKRTFYKYEQGKAIMKVSMMEKFSRIFYDEHYQYSQNILSLNTNGFYAYNPLNSINGVGYGKVIKCFLNKNGKSEGKIETYYNNNPDIVPKQPSDGLNISTFVALPAFKDVNCPENGTVKLIRYFDRNNIKLKEISYDYRNFQSPIYYGAKTSVYATYRMVTNDPAASATYDIPLYAVGLYPIVDFESLLTNKIDKEYFGTDSIITSEVYIYNGNRNLQHVTKYNGQSFLYITSYFYNPDCISEPMIINQSGKNVFNISRTFKTINGKSLLTEERKTEQHTTDTPRITYYDLYNNKSCLLQKRDFDNHTTSYLWSYNNLYPIAKIENATYEEIRNLLGGETYLNQLAATTFLDNSYYEKINTLRALLPKAYITTYKYKPLVGLLETTNPSGITTYYDYDSFGKLKETYIIENNLKKVLEKYDYHYKN
ncbi:hypothetical protein [uncultured Bacteroides sp.]|uniref:hypothetical protein n=1 Tax=uncultured Bacteroides sp. TaxID=162156 RepID=UPI002AA6D059|nr:hypothetical protein [uncultured Bacteroides sp.]